MNKCRPCYCRREVGAGWWLRPASSHSWSWMEPATRLGSSWSLSGYQKWEKDLFSFSTTLESHFKEYSFLREALGNGRSQVAAVGSIQVTNKLLTVLKEKYQKIFEPFNFACRHYNALNSVHRVSRWRVICSLGRFTAKNQYRELETNIPRKGIARPHSANFHSHVSVLDLCIPTINLPILLQEICGPILGIYKSLSDHYILQNSK